MVVAHQRKKNTIALEAYKNCNLNNTTALSILEAYKNAKSEADDFYNNEMNKVTGGMQLPFDLKSFL